MWEQPTPIGGVWDLEANPTIGFGIGVHFAAILHPVIKNDAYMTIVDREIDDGDLDNGAFRKIGVRRYYWIIEH